MLGGFAGLLFDLGEDFLVVAVHGLGLKITV
jgi:hypothetical protein